MKTKHIQHILLTDNVVINGKSVSAGIFLKKDYFVISSDNQILSNFPTVDTDELWEYCLSLVNKGQATFIYTHVNYLEDGEKPISCNGCPHQSFTSGYFDQERPQHRMSCNAKGIDKWFHETLKDNLIQKHFDNKTKPIDCPKS